jgi:hypothetical protein
LVNREQPTTEELQWSERIRVLQADLEALVALTFTHNEPVLESRIRLAATILRRWLADGDLQRLLDAARLQALFPTCCTDDAVAYATAARFHYLLAAGIHLDGRPIFHIGDSPLDRQEIDYGFAVPKPANLTLKKFLSQRRLFFEGRWFTRKQIISFVANKLGGNHLDFTRDGDFEALDRANRWMAFGGPELDDIPPGSERYLILEPKSQEILGGAHLEILAAAASFARVEIDGKPLQLLTFSTSLVNELRKRFRRRKQPKLLSRR